MVTPRVEETEGAAEGGLDKGKGLQAASEQGTPWVPNFITSDKKQVLKSDSLQEDPSLAFTLHSGLMLPKDITKPPSLKTALNDYYFHAGRVRNLLSYFPFVRYVLPRLILRRNPGHTINHGRSTLSHRARQADKIAKAKGAAW
jgi:hypothetical protein